MSDIYQQIWDADQAGSGLKAIFSDQPVTSELAASGYVSVNHDLDVNNPDTKVIVDTQIPAHKQRTYELCKKLFNNYALAEPANEIETPEEREEVHEFLHDIADAPAMQVAHEYIEAAIGTSISSERWYTMLVEMWFRRFSSGGDPDLSGFEHVVVGEQEGAKVQGYHFWFKYYLDDGFATEVDGNRGGFPGLRDDRIVYLKSFATAEQRSFPESVTISYKWDAPDYDARARRPLTKPKGGFFVGCSVEGLMAMGTVRAHVTANAPKAAIINGARYDLAVYRSPDNKNIRTFYPMFLGPAPGHVESDPNGPVTPPQPPQPPQPGNVNGPVRIVGALVNPIGDDPGQETVLLVNTGSAKVSLAGWRLVDKMNHHFDLNAYELSGGSATTILLPKNSIQLSNKGGEIRLVNPANKTVHRVSYTKQQADREGETILF